MDRDAIQEKKLIKAEPKQDLQELFLRRLGGFLPNEPIKGALPSDYAEGQLPDQGTVCRAKRGPGKLSFKQIFQIIARFGVAPEDADGNFSWFFHKNCLIMVFVQVQASLMLII